MNIFLVTMPTLMWTLVPPMPLHRVNPKHYWRDTLIAVAPIAAISGIAVMLSYWLVARAYPHAHSKVTTAVLLVATFFGVYLVFLAPRMLGVLLTKRSLYAQLLYIAAVIVVSVATFRFEFLQNFFNFTRPSWDYALPLLLIVCIAAVIQYQIAGYAGRRLKQANYRE